MYLKVFQLLKQLQYVSQKNTVLLSNVPHPPLNVAAEVFLTAHQTLFLNTHLRDGETLLVHAVCVSFGASITHPLTHPHTPLTHREQVGLDWLLYNWPGPFSKVSKSLQLQASNPCN